MNDNNEKIQNRLKNVKNILSIVSGKGGVGKSTVCAQLAISLFNKGYKVGILDIDLCGPSIPKILGVNEEEVYHSSDGWVPVIVNSKGLVCMSIGFLLKGDNNAVIWRGPRKHVMIKQFLEDVVWGELDFLVIDTPPGTSDEHISIFQMLTRSSAVIVTQPQTVSIVDVKKEISFCKKLKIPIIGLIENMSGFKCPCCGEISYIFSKNGGKNLSEQCGITFLGALPLDHKLSEAEDRGDVNFIKKFKDSDISKQFDQISTYIIDKLKK